MELAKILGVDMEKKLSGIGVLCRQCQKCFLLFFFWFMVFVSL